MNEFISVLYGIMAGVLVYLVFALYRIYHLIKMEKRFPVDMGIKDDEERFKKYGFY